MCLRGASAVEKSLTEIPDAKIAVFAVWEPILSSDFIPPTTGALGRLSDRRVRQFWDKNHRLAKVMAESRVGQPQPDCCDRNGTLWDLIAVYPPGSEWREKLPPAKLFNGPVVQQMARGRPF